MKPCERHHFKSIANFGMLSGKIHTWCVWCGMTPKEARQEDAKEDYKKQYKKQYKEVLEKLRPEGVSNGLLR